MHTSNEPIQSFDSRNVLGLSPMVTKACWIMGIDGTLTGAVVPADAVDAADAVGDDCCCWIHEHMVCKVL